MDFRRWAPCKRSHRNLNWLQLSSPMKVNNNPFLSIINVETGSKVEPITVFSMRPLAWITSTPDVDRAAVMLKRTQDYPFSRGPANGSLECSGLENSVHTSPIITNSGLKQSWVLEKPLKCENDPSDPWPRPLTLNPGADKLQAKVHGTSRLHVDNRIVMMSWLQINDMMDSDGNTRESAVKYPCFHKT